MIILLLFVALPNVPYFSKYFIPTGDAKSAFATLYYYYNHLYFEGELPRWMSHGLYGGNSMIYQLLDLGYFSYFIGLVGWIFRVKDVLWLYKLTVVCSQLLLLIGIYLLARRLYQNRLTVLLVSITALCCGIWYWAPSVDYRIFQSIPLALYLLWRFFEKRQPECLWLIGIVLVISLPGSLLYSLPVWVFSLALVALFLLPYYGRSWRHLFTPSRSNFSAFALLLLILASLALSGGYSQEGHVFYEPGRDFATGRTTLENFLGSNSGPNSLGFFDGFLRLPTYLFTHTRYIGLLPWAAFLLALLTVRSPWFFACAGTFIVLVIFSFGGVMAYLVYHLPFMSMYRYLIVTSTFSRIFLLLAAGFGMDRLFSALPDLSALQARLSWMHLVLFLLILFGLFDLMYAEHFRALILHTARADQGKYYHLGHAGAMLLRLGTYAVAAIVLFGWVKRPGLFPRRGVSLVAGCWAGALVMDGLLYQGEAWYHRPLERSCGALELAPLRYVPQRTWEMDAATRSRHEVLTASQESGVYPLFACVIQYDSCLPYGWTTHFPAVVDRLIRARGGRLAKWSFQSKLPRQDRALLRVLGCEAPKLRLLSRAVYADTVAEAQHWVTTSSELDRVVVLRGVPEQERVLPDDEKPAPVSPPPGTITVTRFNANRLEAEVVVEQDPPVWLVYADSFHPGWRAVVNGRQIPILEAYLAFKAVPLQRGRNVVAFSFHHDVVHAWAISFLLLLSLGFAAMILGWVIWLGVMPLRK